MDLQTVVELKVLLLKIAKESRYQPIFPETEDNDTLAPEEPENFCLVPWNLLEEIYLKLGFEDLEEAISIIAVADSEGMTHAEALRFMRRNPKPYACEITPGPLPEPLPCPFCASPGLMRKAGNKKKGTMNYWVECSAGRLGCSYSPLPEAAYWVSEALALDAWNSRQNQSKQ